MVPRTPRREIFFATCAPGLEPFLHAEASEARLARVERQVGGIHFEGSIQDAWRANLRLRIAVRILMRVARYAAGNSDALYAGASKVPWERWVRPDGTLVVSVRGSRSAFDNTMFVAQRVKDAIVDRFREQTGTRPSVDKENPDLVVNVHLARERVTLSVDTSGDSLHKRGWRQYGGAAPLAETLAAAVVRAAEWDGRSPVIDPFCGSGTLLIEAAHAALGTPPGSFRKQFGFEKFPDHDAAAWAKLRADAIAAVEPRKLILRGSDLDRRALDGARSNAEAAGVSERIDLNRSNAFDAPLKKGWNGWILANLPYGERVGRRRDLATLLSSFGRRLREHAVGYHLAFLVGDERDLAALELPGMRTTPLKNGALDVLLVTGEIRRGG